MNHKEFVRRRKQLMRMMGPDSVAIVPAAPQRYRNREVEYHYRQDSDFYYLTGFPEPEAVAVLVPGREQAEYILFCRERDPAVETWTGYRAGQEGAVDTYGADDSFPLGDVDDILPGMLEDRERVYYTVGIFPEFDQRVFAWVNRIRRGSRSGSRTPDEYVSLEHLLHDMRLFKSKAELKNMRRAAEISVRAHRHAMQVCRPSVYEYQIEAELVYEFRRSGAEPAYPSIVGSGANACILHYTENRGRLEDGDLLLIDAGAEYDYYAADITRTFPVNGSFGRWQRALYELVLSAQRAAIDKVRPGNSWNEPHAAAVEALTEGMVELGLLKGKVPRLIRDEAYRRFYMHRTGHWLGMDVHDVGDYKVGGEWRVLEPGMVLTVEPGIYVPANSKGIAKKWWNTGVRIEDDVLVTEGDPQVLSEKLPKDIDEIEALMAG
ncbi:MAG: Xaa-Pro aminopeptidase [Gammaproteobacteria bacterium]|nr:Xaa-Pro aminopeptidase [Gammaproteobacteria bacterium]NIR98426.1 Xaa-Pro aminopeptidase [Gammaproteobacteria bacterium]NIT64173.1 Xaa-Pro aminopeptidase [Gammaproteobacteria bacterium]NIV21113.1 Xaa-Pro aminopeptidase [Gammaproteobacteria bacterium]NIX10590.1 Xaa-Pro aminopeptidase [Gammaproteobacteria bacterium]